MKRIEWVIASALVVIGLSCLTMSATSIMSLNTYHVYLSNLFKICLWTGIPVAIIGIAYLIMKRNKKD
ncbi:MAG TPA: hypothetical protein VGE40_09330 [Bacilli bacterium]